MYGEPLLACSRQGAVVSPADTNSATTQLAALTRPVLRHDYFAFYYRLHLVANATACLVVLESRYYGWK